MAECDALVLPAVTDPVSGTEGLGVVLLEAMVHERPVIASNVGGIPDVVQHEHTGLLVPPGDVDALAGAMRSLIDDPEKARSLALAGRQHAESRFSWPHIVRELATVYERAVAQRAR